MSQSDGYEEEINLECELGHRPHNPQGAQVVQTISGGIGQNVRYCGDLSLRMLNSFSD
ncbi:hypothetical protein GCM10022249_01250 [Enteractinococcus coprophilus]